MPLYRATHKETREVVEYDEPTPRAEHRQPQWSVSEVVVYVPSQDEPPPPPPTVYGGRRVLTKREFLVLFTPQERMQLRAFSKGNSPQAAMVEDYMFLLEQSQDVTLDHPDTIAGVQMLEAGGLLGAGRAEEILRG